MADNIFDAEIGRRIQHLQQQSAGNIIKVNPNLRSVLSRYEDAEVSRLKLLELQQLRSKKLTPLEKKALKGIAKSARPSKGRATKGRATKEKKVEEPQKSTLQVEIDRLEQIEKLKREEKKLQQQDRFLQLEDFRQQREFVANERRIQLGDIQSQRKFISGQNRLLADQYIAQYIQAQANFRAQGQRQIEERKLQQQLKDIRERVARDDAFRHAQLQEQQRLALEQLANQRQENTERAETERLKIQNQRAVDAERAITDRELIQTLQSTIDTLNRTKESQQQPSGESGSGFVEEVFSRGQRGLSERELAGEGRFLRGGERNKPKRYEGGATQEELAAAGGIEGQTPSSRKTEPQPEPERTYTSSQRSAERDLDVAASNTSLHSQETTPATTLKESGVYQPKVKTLAEVRKDNPVEDIRD